MCDGLGQPASVTEALGMLDRALDHLTAADTASLPTGIQAQALRSLERAAAKHTVARARVLAAFTTQDGYEDDGQGSARTWLRWHTRVTSGAAAGAVGWARRLAAHPVIGDALAAGDVSESWARQICAWTSQLPEGQWGDADEILAAAARGRVDLAGLAGLAREMYERSHRDHDRDCGDGSGDRAVSLGTTFGGAGRLTGDLTPGCSAALTAVLDALGKRAGPEDLRTVVQRRHDALEEACRRLVAAGMLPGRAGQPTQVHLHMSLAQLRGESGASHIEAAWAAARASEPGWLTGAEADAAACDATIVPVVTGHIDWAALDHLTDIYLATKATDGGNLAGSAPKTSDPSGGQASAGGVVHDGCGCTCGRCHCRGSQPLSADTRRRLSRALLAVAAGALSGPGGLAARLRGCLDGRFLTSVSLPLDIGAATETIPSHLRRAVTTRHRRCGFPGCQQPASVCDIHHVIPRSRGGPTSLANLVPLCTFHHLTVIHRWGWALRLNSDGTTTATSPDGIRTLHSHGPPRQAA